MTGGIIKNETETNKVEVFCRIFGIPDFLEPWLDRFFEEAEIDLVLVLAGRPMSADEIRKKISLIADMDKTQNLPSFLMRCYKRGVINRLGDGRYQPADLHTRYDVWAMFEGWKDIPETIREQLNIAEWRYSERHYRDSVSRMQDGRPRDSSEVYAEYILLPEGEALLERVDRVYLLPCNCRAMKKGCDQSIYTCLRFENYRGLGWEISKSRAKGILHQANKKGLMQTAEVSLTETGAICGAICNCCADCCVHPDLAERFDARKVWPLARYVARHLTDRCTSCGLCAKRCPFNAFAIEKIKPARSGNPFSATKKRQKIHLDENLCRGCGVCSTGCPDEAIRMISLDTCRSHYSLVTRLGCGPVSAPGKNNS